MVSSIPAPPGASSGQHNSRLPRSWSSTSGRLSSESPLPQKSSGLPRAPGAAPLNKASSAKELVGASLKKEMGRAVGLKIDDVDNADIERLRAAAANAVQLEQRLMEVEIERARELNDLQEMMASLQTKEEELSKYVSSVQKRRQETDPYEKAQLKIEELEQELEKAMDQNLLDAEHRRLREESSVLRGLFGRIEAAVMKVQAAGQQALLGTEDEMAAMQAQVEQKVLDKEKITQLTEEMLTETEGLKAQLNNETNKRKKLHNQLVNLRGAIRVFCRVRPMLNAAGESINGNISTTVDEASDLVAVSGARANAIRPQDVKEKRYQFDRVFAMESTQESIYDETSGVVTSVLDGYNVCIFAYGQTGSGKTHTMEGTHDARGVNYRTLSELFDLAKLRQAQMEYRFQVSLMEVYNEEIRDLLADHQAQEVTWSTHGKAAGRPHLDLRVQPSGAVEFPGLITSEVDNLAAAWEVLQRASSVRTSGETKSNAHSSRSHCLLRVTVHGMNKLNKDEMTAKLWLVDLAGSERVGKSEAKGDRLKEAQFINRSLSSLGDCIFALATKSQHVPYRNSKLTHMLQDSLGGDSKTVMIVNVSPNLNDVGETTCSLNFASRVRGVEMGPAKRHVESNMSEVQKAKMQATDLKVQVEELQEVKVSQQKKIREHISESEQLRETLRKQEKAMAKMERRVAKLKQQVGAAALEEEEEEEEAEEEDEPVAINGTAPFLAPTASPVFKATSAAPIESASSSRSPSGTIPAGQSLPRVFASLSGSQSQVGEALSARNTSKASSGPVEFVSVIATDINIPQPTNAAFAARFADYRTKPDLQPVTEQQQELMTKDKKKKGTFGKKAKKWIGIF